MLWFSTITHELFTLHLSNNWRNMSVSSLFLCSIMGHFSFSFPTLQQWTKGNLKEDMFWCLVDGTTQKPIIIDARLTYQGKNIIIPSLDSLFIWKKMGSHHFPFGPCSCSCILRNYEGNAFIISIVRTHYQCNRRTCTWFSTYFKTCACSSVKIR